MGSPTDLVNDALLLLGEKTILSLDDDLDVAKVCKGLYPRSRDYVLAQHPWNGCVKHVALTRVAASPVMTHTYAYLYPADAIRLLLPDLDYYVWEIGANTAEEKLVWLAYELPSVRYIFKNAVTELYSPWLAETLVTYLASKFAFPLTDDRGKAEAMHQRYLLTLSQAKMLDGQEQSPVTLPATTLTDDVRWGG